MNYQILRALIFGIFLPFVALAQDDAPPPPSDAPMQTLAQPVEAQTVTEPVFQAASSETAKPVLVSVLAAAQRPEAKPISEVPTAKGEIRLNFQNASLADVLNYLSEAAGFIILQDAPVVGNVNVVSKQPVTVDDAVDLVNSVLIDKGYTAIRNGRILKIINRKDAQKQDIPVMSGSDPNQIPRKDGMVTQILPVHYVDATKLVENLRPLLSSDATLNANEASNTLLLADTQTNIHRIAEIVHALDTSVSSISAIRVFQLQYADSKSLASILTQLFASDQNTSRGGASSGGSGGGGRGSNLPPWAAAMMGGRGGNQGSTQSAAQIASSRVVTVSDDQSNSVIVSAPEAAMTTISDIISRIDTNIADITETRIFKLEHADCTELANVLTSLYSDPNSLTASTGSSNTNRRPQTTSTSSTPANRSERSLLQSRVVAVPDPRTNSLLISAARDSMMQIALTVGRLDSGESRKQKVFVHSLENADPDNVATILRGMFGGQNASSNTSAQPSSNQLNQRTSSDITNLLNTSSGNSSSSRLR